MLVGPMLLRGFFSGGQGVKDMRIRELNGDGIVKGIHGGELSLFRSWTGFSTTDCG